MIFPTVNFADGVFSKTSAYYIRAGLVNTFVDASLRVISETDVHLDDVRSEDGAVLEKVFAADRSGKLNLRITYDGTCKAFDGCSLVSFGDGWLVLVQGDSRTHVAYNYFETRTLEFASADDVALYYFNNFFFERGLWSWCVYSAQGEKICECDIEMDGARPDNCSDIYNAGDCIYLSGGGDGVNAFLWPFSLETAALLSKVTRSSGYIISTVHMNDSSVLLDESGLYKVSSGSLLSAEKFVSFAPGEFAGVIWLWRHNEQLHVASSASPILNIYDFSGALSKSLTLPSDWRFFWGNGVRPSVVDGNSLVFLCPNDLSVWGAGALLVYAQAHEAELEQETLSLLAVETVAGSDGDHGYKIVLGAASLDVGVRHATHHLALLANKVAPGLMNRGAAVDERFNGVFEIDLITPQALREDSLHGEYLVEFFSQMKAVPQSYKASDGKGSLSFSVSWRSSADSDPEEIFSRV